MFDVTIYRRDKNGHFLDGNGRPLTFGPNAMEAVSDGFYRGVRVREGERFDLHPENIPSFKWMQPVDREGNLRDWTADEVESIEARKKAAKAAWWKANPTRVRVGGKFMRGQKGKVVKGDPKQPRTMKEAGDAQPAPKGAVG